MRLRQTAQRTQRQRLRPEHSCLAVSQILILQKFNRAKTAPEGSNEQASQRMV
jgi:hypothetical protein